ncbi:MAG: hypothetical protein MUO31_13270 [Thermodesulfovibrionales bacterium]|nr:hypothetical protein [Thermodesulfovibrionales bacterium]
MKTKQTKTNYVATPIFNDDICLNNQTVGNLKKYLAHFSDDAKVIIHHACIVYDCQICCNFEHQEETNTAQLMLGFPKAENKE